jgi:hypothetical protein
MKSNFSTPGFLWPLLTLICIAVIAYGLILTLRKTTWTKQRDLKIFFAITTTILAWAALLTVLSYKGFFADFSKLPPRPVLALLIPLPFVLIFVFSKTGAKILELIPAQWLVLMQSFRIFVEVLIWFAFLANKLPVQMSFEGKNFDVLTGILALPIGYLLIRKAAYSPKLIIVFNVVGLLLLLNILIIAVLSMPTSFHYFTNEPSATLIAQFPFILLPGVLVPIAYSFHIFSLRQLFINKTNKLKA